MRRALTKTTLKLGALAQSVGRRRLLFQVIAAATAFFLGFWGWMLKSPPADWQGWANNFFRTIQLITLQFPTEFDGSLPVPLQIGRLAVPIVAVLASINVLVGAVTRPMRLALLPYQKDHVIFFGTPKLTDDAMATLISHDHHLVIVQPTIDAGRLDILEGIGVTIVTGDPLQSPILDDLNLASARALFVATGNDVDNANLAILLLERAGMRSPDVERQILAVEFEREDLADVLVAAVDETARKRSVRFYRLAPDREGISLELRRHAPAFSRTRGDARGHVLVVGLVGAWGQVLSRLFVALQDRPDESPIVSLILDENERERFERWRSERPDLGLLIDFHVFPRVNSRSPAWTEIRDSMPSLSVPQLVIIMRDDADGLATAFGLRNVVDWLHPSTPILVRQSREDRILPRLAEQAAGAAGTGTLVPFGGLLREESVERLFDPDGEREAIALHSMYARNADASGRLGATPAWEQLAETYRDANRASVAHREILGASASIGRPFGDGIVPQDLSEEEWERLARIEHRRWCADRIDRGWRHGEKRDDERRTHPAIVEWDALSPADRAKDRASVRMLFMAPGQGAEATSTRPQG